MSEPEEKDSAAASEYYIRVLTDDANAPLTEKGGRIYERSEILVPGIYRSTILQPGDAVMADVSVTDIYDLTQPGHYVIWVERKLPTELGGGYVSSNTITVTVTK
jgi:hypothetical protein